MTLVGSAPVSHDLVQFDNGKITFGETVSRIADALSPFGASARVIAELAACKTEHRRLSVTERHIDAQHEYNLASLQSRRAAMDETLSQTRKQLDSSDKRAKAQQRALDRILQDMSRAPAEREVWLEAYRIGSARLASDVAAQGEQLNQKFDNLLNGPGAMAVAPKPLPNLPTARSAGRSTDPIGGQRRPRRSANRRPSER
jgi:hypothetical protein